jgi:dienelactone hydrolase
MAGLLHRLVWPLRGALLMAAMLSLGPAARGDPSYTGTGVTVHSTAGGVAQDLPATLLKPAGAGPFPAIVVLHDCSGLGSHSSGAPGRWGSVLAMQGYVVLVSDSFLPRGLPDGVCMTGPGPARAAASVYRRAGDAYAALAYLRTLAFVDGRHVGVMGGSHGGSTTLATMVMTEDPNQNAARRAGFAAAVALYPGCGAGYGGRWTIRRQGGAAVGPVTDFLGAYQPVAPLLILIGEKDDWTPAEHCRVLAARAAELGYPVTLKIYPGAYHSFDSPSPTRYVPSRNNANKLDGRGATTGGNPDAWADSIKEVTGFFAAHLKASP